MQLEYADHLYSDDLEGFVQVLQLNNGRVLRIYNTDCKGIKEVVEDMLGEEDTYITSNSFYIPKRSSDTIRHFRALFSDIDLDLDKIGKAEAVYMVYDLAYKGKIPKPTMIVDSGRGLHIYWRIEHAPKGAIYTWQELEDYLYYQLKHLGADIRATDCARVLRLPGTINSKNGVECTILDIDRSLCYSMYDLREQYLDYKPKKQAKSTANSSNKGNVKHYFNSYTLHLARAKDIEKLCKLRDYRVTGYRNMIIHCYTYWQGIYTRDLEELEFLVNSLNDKFTEPLKGNEIKSVTKSVQKAIDKFIDYEQGLRDGNVKRVSKGMRDKGGYWYKNETLIDRLDISVEEQRQLETIIGTKVKYERNNAKRTPRNAEGLTHREQRKRELIEKVNVLKDRGLKQVEIARKLGISKGRVSQIFKVLQKV